MIVFMHKESQFSAILADNFDSYFCKRMGFLGRILKGEKIFLLNFWCRKNISAIFYLQNNLPVKKEKHVVESKLMLEIGRK